MSGEAMDWVRYRALCDRGDVASRFLLEHTCALLRDGDQPALLQALERVLRQPPLPKPADHRAGPESDFFCLDLNLAQARTLLDCIRQARSAGWRTASGRSLGGFVEAWQEYVDWISGSHPRSPHRGRDS